MSDPASDLFGGIIKLIFGVALLIFKGIWFVLSSIAGLFTRGSFYRRINKNNAASRGVAALSPEQGRRLVTQVASSGNTVISGGNRDMRNRAVVPAILGLHSQGVPVIVIHASNAMLEREIINTCEDKSRISVINAQNPVFEPFAGLDNKQITRLIMDAVPQERELEPGARQYLDAMSEILSVKGVRPFCNAYVRCPHAELFEKADNLVSSGLIDDNGGRRIKSMLSIGQDEGIKLEGYFCDLETHIAHILCKKGNTPGAQNILTAVRDGRLLMLDVKSVANTLVVGLIAAQAILALQERLEFVLVADSIALNESQMLMKALKSGCRYIISTDDLYTATGANDESYSALVGNISGLVLYRHTLGSCARWSEFFGEYDKQELSYSGTEGKNDIGMLEAFGKRSTSSTISLSVKRETVIKPEDIGGLGDNQAFIYSSSAGSTGIGYI
ncbi:hypothetical protein DFR58_11367 [Anaerobacterium chartisolvens]|uniref:Uncharacterized protein n=1 Tax=Anaerobacterium chartisolvens TaxID=1297424 RepID=A0A369B2B9_9FIRM|nr:hypothetical protein [Anaerobacterium chartisolvens]RCX15485.1 hypothetical protein DFR58_11367 [Anaerobacterium chartisolvens]